MGGMFKGCVFPSSQDDQPLAKMAAKPTAVRDWEQQTIAAERLVRDPGRFHHGKWPKVAPENGCIIWLCNHHGKWEISPWKMALSLCFEDVFRMALRWFVEHGVIHGVGRWSYDYVCLIAWNMFRRVTWRIATGPFVCNGLFLWVLICFNHGAWWHCCPNLIVQSNQFNQGSHDSMNLRSSPWLDQHWYDWISKSLISLLWIYGYHWYHQYHWYMDITMI